MSTRMEATPIINSMWKENHAKLVAYMRQRGVPHPEDVAQETFLRAARRVEAIPLSDKERSKWLFSVAKNVIRENVRSHRRHPLELNDNVVGDAQATHKTPEEQVTTYEDVDWFNQEMETLSAELRAPFVLYYKDGHSQEEIAKTLGIPEGSVARRLWIARNQLQVAYQKRQGEASRRSRCHALLVAALPSTATSINGGNMLYAWFHFLVKVLSTASLVPAILLGTAAGIVAGAGLWVAPVDEWVISSLAGKGSGQTITSDNRSVVSNALVNVGTPGSSGDKGPADPTVPKGDGNESASADSAIERPTPMGIRVQLNTAPTTTQRAEDSKYAHSGGVSYPSAIPGVDAAPLASSTTLPPSELQLEVQWMTELRSLVASDPTAALQSIETHRGQFSHPQFVAERELLAVRALRVLGRSAEAELRARAFVERSPASASVGKFERQIHENPAVASSKPQH